MKKNMKSAHFSIFSRVSLLLAAVFGMWPVFGMAQTPVNGNYVLTDANAGENFALNAGWGLTFNQANSLTISVASQAAYGEFAVNSGELILSNYGPAGTMLTGFLKSGAGTLTMPSNIYLAGSAAAPPTVDVTGGTLNLPYLSQGYGNGQYGVLNLSNDAKVNIAGEFTTGNMAADASGGSVSMSGTSELTIGASVYMGNNGGVTTFTMTDEAKLFVNAGQFNVGTRGAAFTTTFGMSGKSSGEFYQFNVGGNHGAGNGSGIVTMTDEASATVSNNFILGGYSAGVLNMSGNSKFTSNAANIWIANAAGGVGTLNLSGNAVFTANSVLNAGTRSTSQITVAGNATLTVRDNFLLGYGADGNAHTSTVYQSGGTVNANGGITFGNQATAKAEYHLAGGVLNVTTLANGSATSCERLFRMTGGTLNAGTISTDVTQLGGVLTVGGDNKIGTTAINAAYMLGSSAGGIGTVNIAQGGVATQSSTWPADWGRYPAANAFDGNLNTGNFSHTLGGEAAPWLQVDLGDTYTLGQIVVTNRYANGNNLANGTNNYYFELYDENMNLVKFSDGSENGTTILPTDPAGPSQTYSAPQTLNVTDDTAAGRYLRLVREGSNDHINISEIQVYAREEASRGTLRIEVDAFNPANLDTLAFGAGGLLTLEPGSILEVAFLGDTDDLAGDWQIFDPAVFGNDILGEFSEIVLDNPFWEFTDASIDAFYTTGMLSTQASSQQSVPEPATWVLLLLGVLGMAAVRQRGAR